MEKLINGLISFFFRDPRLAFAEVSDHEHLSRRIGKVCLDIGGANRKVSDGLGDDETLIRHLCLWTPVLERGKR